MPESPKHPQAKYFDPHEANTYVVTGAVISSALALNAEHGARPIIQISANGRWNHGAPDELVLMFSPETWEELVGRDGRRSREVVRAAKRDLADYQAGRVIRPHGLSHGEEPV